MPHMLDYPRGFLGVDSPYRVILRTRESSLVPVSLILCTIILSDQVKWERKGVESHFLNFLTAGVRVNVSWDQAFFGGGGSTGD